MSEGMSLANLAALQQLDLDIERAGHEIVSLTAALASEPAIAAARARLKAATDAEAAARKELRDAETTLAETEKRIAQNEQRLTSGAITTTSALAAVEHELSYLREHRDPQEERVLLALDAQDHATTAARAAIEALATTERDRATERDRQQAQLTEARQRHESLVAQRPTLTAASDPAWLTRYEAVRKAKGRAVVAATGGVCQGCRVALQAASIQRLRAGHDELITCTNCGRILMPG